MNIGIDVGGTNLRAGVVTEEGTLLSTAKTPVGRVESPEALIRHLAALSREAMDLAGVTEADIESVGVGIPGAVRGGEIIYTCNLPLLQVPFETIFRRELDLPVYLENDANCAALGEWLYGAGQGLWDFLMITLGTGIGGGLILNGRIYNGGGMAGEVGHMVIERDGLLCNCGRRGCWEAYCSATGLIQAAETAMAHHPESLLHELARPAGLEARTVFQAAERGDETALTLCREYRERLAVGLTNLINIFHPEAVALGGGVAGAPEALLLEPVRAMTSANCYPRNGGQIPCVVSAELGGDAGLIGAAALRTFA